MTCDGLSVVVYCCFTCFHVIIVIHAATRICISNRVCIKGKTKDFRPSSSFYVCDLYSVIIFLLISCLPTFSMFSLIPLLVLNMKAYSLQTTSLYDFE